MYILYKKEKPTREGREGNRVKPMTLLDTEKTYL